MSLNLLRRDKTQLNHSSSPPSHTKKTASRRSLSATRSLPLPSAGPSSRPLPAPPTTKKEQPASRTLRSLASAGRLRFVYRPLDTPPCLPPHPPREAPVRPQVAQPYQGPATCRL